MKFGYFGFFHQIKKYFSHLCSSLLDYKPWKDTLPSEVTDLAVDAAQMFEWLDKRTSSTANQIVKGTSFAGRDLLRDFPGLLLV